MVQLALAQGDLGSAQEALQEAEALLKQEEFANNARWVVDARIQLWLAQGRLTTARAWAAKLSLRWPPGIRCNMGGFLPVDVPPSQSKTMRGRSSAGAV